MSSVSRGREVAQIFLMGFTMEPPEAEGKLLPEILKSQGMGMGKSPLSLFYFS